MMMTELKFSTDNIPDGDWKTYKKHALTKAIKIDGPFTVETSEGPLHCDDGYLAIDSRDYPYPIATEEFQKIYDEVDPSGTPWPYYDQAGLHLYA